MTNDGLVAVNERVLNEFTPPQQMAIINKLNENVLNAIRPATTGEPVRLENPD